MLDIAGTSVAVWHAVTLFASDSGCSMCIKPVLGCDVTCEFVAAKRSSDFRAVKSCYLQGAGGQINYEPAFICMLALPTATTFIVDLV